MLAAGAGAGVRAVLALSPYFLSVDTLSDATFNFTERALVALPLALLIIAGEIDISVARIIALASVAMGWRREAGAGTPALRGVGLGTGLLAGCVNGALVTLARVPSIVATIGTMTLFRGIAYAVLGDRVLKNYPQSFASFGQGYAFGPVSIELVLFAVLAVVFGLFLHRTRWGRAIYAIGANPVASEFARIQVNRYRFVLFGLTGVASGLAAVLLTSRLGSTRPSIAQGLGAGNHQHGDPRRSVCLGRQGQYPWRSPGGTGVWPRDIRTRTHEHPRHRDVDLHRGPVDPRGRRAGAGAAR
jgi:rhamnose transport system permease protein